MIFFIHISEQRNSAESSIFSCSGNTKFIKRAVLSKFSIFNRPIQARKIVNRIITSAAALQVGQGRGIGCQMPFRKIIKIRSQTGLFKCRLYTGHGGMSPTGIGVPLVFNRGNQSQFPGIIALRQSAAPACRFPSINKIILPKARQPLV